MHSKVVVFLGASLYLAAGCSTEGARSNAFDPEAPASIQVKARLEGTVRAADALSHEGVRIVATEALSGGGTPLEYGDTSAADGTFVFEVPAGVYNVAVTRAGYVPAFLNSVEVRPGEVRDLGFFLLDIARGALQGSVALDGGESPTGTAVSLFPLESEGGRVVTVLAGPDGSYFASGLAAGSYGVRAEREGFAPAYTPGLGSAGRQAVEGAISVSADGVSTVPELVLYPAAAIVKVERDGVVLRYTNDPAVQVILYPFVAFLTQMRVSEDATFADNRWDSTYREFTTPVSHLLADTDGVHEIFAQFLDAYALESDVFSTTVMLDRELPHVVSLTINNGAAYLTAEDFAGFAALSFAGRDALSGIDAWRWTLAPAFTSSDAWTPLQSTGPSVVEVSVEALGDDNGVKTVLVQLRDRAGNESVPASASIIRDHIAPNPGAVPIQVDPSDLDINGKAKSLEVTLLLDVVGDRADEPLFMAIANGQAVGSDSLFLPFEPVYEHVLQAGPDDLDREVCVVFKDAAGLMSPRQCVDVSVDRTGGVQGVVLLEGQASHAGVLVQVTHPVTAGGPYSFTTDVDGAYAINGIPSGSGYSMRFFKNDYVQVVAYDVSVVPGVTIDRGTVTLSVPRASVSGTVLLAGRGPGQLGGVTVSDASGQYSAVTGGNGEFVLSGLPAQSGATYTFTASYPGFEPQSFADVTNLLPGEVRLLGALPLQKQQGDFRVCAATSATCAGDIDFTKATTVLLDVATTVNNCWRASTDSSFATAQIPWSGFVNDPQVQDRTFDLGATSTDGLKNIYVQFGIAVDCVAGPVSWDGVTLTGEVTVDRTPPEPALIDPVIIDEDANGLGEVYNNHPDGEVVLSLSASDAGAGLTKVRIARGVADFTGLPKLDFLPMMATTLDTGVQGEQWLYVEFCDLVGNCTCDGGPCVTPIGDSIIYDTVAPSFSTGATIQVLDNPSGLTNSPFVNVRITTGDAVAVRFGNEPILTGRDYIAVAPGQTETFSHILTLGDGPKPVYAQFRDAAGNASEDEPNLNVDTTQLDTQAPTGLALVLPGGSATNQDAFSVDVTAVGASHYMLVVGMVEDFSSGSWQAFTGDAPTYTMTVPAGFAAGAPDGTYTVYVRLRDLAGNVTQTLSRNIVRDHVAPQLASLDFLEGDFTTVQTVNLILNAVGASQMIVAADGVLSDEQPELYSPAKTIDLLPGVVGTHTVTVRYLDQAGNYVDVSETIEWDGLPPSLTSFAVAEAPYTTSASVTLQINAVGATRMRLSNNIGFLGASWEGYATSRAWVLLPGDDSKNVYLQLSDDAGNISNSAAATTILDTTPPQGLVVSIAGGAPYTLSNSVTLTLDATDANGVDEVMVANDALYTGAVWQDYATTINSWPLTAGDGPKTVYVRFKDTAGLVSEKADSITVDTTSPVGTLVLANDAAAITSAAVVPVTIVASSDVQFMKFVEGAAVNCSAETIDVPFNGNTTYPFAGSPGDGPLALTVCLKDFAGRIGSAVDTVLLDTQQPGASLLINGGTGLYTRSTVVTLSIGASDVGGSGVSGVRIANQQDMTGVAWDAPTSPRTWTVDTSGGVEGPKTVWLEVRDVAGNVHDNVSATITVDVTPPSGSLTVSGGPYSQDALVDLVVACSDQSIACSDNPAVAQIAVAEGFLDCNGAAYGPFTANIANFSLSPGDGAKNISLCVRDRAGNTAGFSATVTVDTDNPDGTLSINAGAPYSQSTALTLHVSAEADVVQMRAADGASIDCGSGTYVAFASPWVMSPPIAAGDGLRTVSLCLKDAAGRTAGVTDTIVVDSANPAPATLMPGKVGIVIDGDAPYTNDTQVGLALAATDTPAESGVTEMKISDGGACAGGNWQPYVTSASWNLSAGDNVGRDVSVQFRDAAGRVSACAVDSITIDTVGSTVTVFSIDGQGVTPEHTNDAVVSVTNLTYSGTCSLIEIGEDPAFVVNTSTYPCGQVWPANYTLVSYAADGSLDGAKTIYARVRDAANNPNPSVSRSVILDTQGAFSGNFHINGDATITNSRTLTLALSAVNATEMYIAANSSCTGGAWEAFKTSTVLNHPSSASSLDVSVLFRDAASNTSSCLAKSIAYDAGWSGGGSVVVVPVVGVSPYTTSLDVTLTLTCGEPATTTEMKISNDGACSGGSWVPYPQATSPVNAYAWTLASGGDDVQRSVSVQYRDAAGNVSGCYVDTVDVDTVAPAGLSITLDGGAPYNIDDGRLASVTVSGLGFVDVRLSESPAFVGATWITGVANPHLGTFQLSPGSGDKTVYVQARDAAGNVSVSSASDSIAHDATEPVGAALALDGGATFTTSGTGTVTIALSATDDFSGVTSVRYRTSADGSTWSSYTTVGYQPTINVVLADPVAAQDDVTRHVQLSYIDKAGNIGAVQSATIRLDNVGPVVGTPPIEIDGNAPSTQTQIVTLTLSATGASEMLISNGQLCSAGSWQTYATSVAGWALDGVGDNIEKFVSVRFRDPAGNTTGCVADDIDVDNVGPVSQSFVIAGGASYSNTDTLAYTLIYSGTATERYVATSVAALDGAPAELPSDPQVFNLPPATPDGTVILYVRLHDAAGNMSSVLSDTIVRDKTAPTAGLMQIDNDAFYSTSASGSVNLSLSANDGAGSGVATVFYRTSEDGSTWSAYTGVPYQPSIGITLPSPASQDAVSRYVEVYFRDAAGNDSATLSDEIVLDNVAPGLTSLRVENLAGGSTITNSNSVYVNITGYSGNPTTMQVSNNDSCSGGQTVAFEPFFFWQLGESGGSGSADVSVRLFDDAGLQSGCISDAIDFDMEPPSLNWLGLAAYFDGAGNAVGTWWNFTKDCYLAINGGNVQGTYAYMDFSMSAGFSSVFASIDSATIAATNWPTSATYYGLLIPAPSGGSPGCTTDGANEGTRKVYFRARDAAGNVSAASSFDFIVDTVAPAITSTMIEGGAAYASSSYVQVSVSSSDANYVYWLYLDSSDGGDDDNVCTGASSSNQNYYFYGGNGQVGYSLNGTSGTKTIYACVQDAAGNNSADDNVGALVNHWDDIILDGDAPTGLSMVMDASPVDYVGGAAGALQCSGGTPNDAHWTTSARITLLLTAADPGAGLGLVRIIEDGSYSPAMSVAWAGGAATARYQLSDVNGPKVLGYEVLDNAGNVATLGSAVCVTLDNQPPTDVSLGIGPVLTYTGTDITRSATITATDVQSGSAGMQMCFGSGSTLRPNGIQTSAGVVIGSESTSVNCDSAANWYNFASNIRLVFDAGAAQHLAVLYVRDAAGNKVYSAAVGTNLDTAAPYAVTASIDEGAYTASQTVNATLTAYDNVAVSQMCFGAGSDLLPNGVRNNTGISLGSKSTYTNCEHPTDGWLAYNPDLRFDLTAGDGSKRAFLFVRDSSGNRYPSVAGADTAAVATTILDSTNPLTSDLTVVTVGNKSAHLYWTASSDSGSGLDYYEIEYRQTSPSVGAPSTFTVAPDLADYEITAEELSLQGLPALINRYRYEFRIRARDVAGRYSAYSAYRANTVGWARTSAVFSSTNALIPFGITEYDGIIYVGYLKYEVQWGNIASTAHVAISADGGASWQTRNIDLTPCPLRETMELYAGPSGVLVVGVYDADTSATSDIRLASWLSTDQGASWLLTELDVGNSPDALGGVALTKEGGALVALYERGTTSYAVRSYDGGRSWTTAYATYAHAAYGVEAHAACNTQFNVSWAHRDADTGSLYLMRSSDLGATSVLTTTVANVRHAALACTNPTILASYGRAYAVYTNTGAVLSMRSHFDPAAGAWDASDIVLRASGVDTLARPGIYASGTTDSQTVFVAYRDTGGNVVIGQSTNPTLDTSYVWTDADKSGDVGVNLVLGGTAQGSPLLAYTDEAGQSLYVLRSSVPAPTVRASATEDKISLTWRGVAGASGYQVNGLVDPVVISDTNYTVIGSVAATTFEVMGLDAHGQTGEPGMQWEMGTFTPDTINNASASITTTFKSSTGRMIVSGSQVLSLLPTGFPATYGTLSSQCDSLNDICLYVSTDGGATFAGVRVWDMSTTPQVAKHMSLSTDNNSNPRLHLVHTSPFATDPDLWYWYAGSPYTSWSWVGIDSTNTATVGDATGEQVQISAQGNYVLIAWVLQTPEQTPPCNSGSVNTDECRSIRYVYSTNGGNVAGSPTFSSRLYMNASNATADIGYTPQSLTIVDHGSTNALLAWIDGSSKVRIGYNGSISNQLGWTVNTVSSTEVVKFIRGARFGDTHVIAWIGNDGNFGSSDSVWAYVGGISANTSGATGWTRVPIDTEIAVQDSLDMGLNSSGFYVTYATVKTLFGTQTRQLKLAYCKHECAGRNNWHINVLRTDSDVEADDFGGIQLGIDSSTNNLYVGGGQEVPGTDRYLLDRGGRFNRRR